MKLNLESSAAEATPPLLRGVRVGPYDLPNRVIMAPLDADACRRRQCAAVLECRVLPPACGRGLDRYGGHARFSLWPWLCRYPGDSLFRASGRLEADHECGPRCRGTHLRAVVARRTAVSSVTAAGGRSARRPVGRRLRRIRADPARTAASSRAARAGVERDPRDCGRVPAGRNQRDAGGLRRRGSPRRQWLSA